MDSTTHQTDCFKIPPLPWKPDVAHLVIEECRRSKLPVSKFAALHGVPAHRIHYWRAKLTEAQASLRPGHDLLEVRLTGAAGSARPESSRFVEVSVPEGPVLKFFEDIHPDTLARLLATCRARPC